MYMLVKSDMVDCKWYEMEKTDLVAGVFPHPPAICFVRSAAAHRALIHQRITKFMGDGNQLALPLLSEGVAVLMWAEPHPTPPVVNW